MIYWEGTDSSHEKLQFINIVLPKNVDKNVNDTFANSEGYMRGEFMTLEDLKHYYECWND